MLEFWTVALGMLCGVVGGGVASAMWMKTSKEKELAGGPTLKDDKASVISRLHLYLINLLLGGTLGSIVGFLGFQNTSNIEMIFIVSFISGVTPGAYVKFMSKSISLQ